MVTELRGQPFVSLQFHRTPASWLPITASYHLSLLGRVAVTAGQGPGGLRRSRAAAREGEEPAALRLERFERFASAGQLPSGRLFAL